MNLWMDLRSGRIQEENPKWTLKDILTGTPQDKDPMEHLWSEIFWIYLKTMPRQPEVARSSRNN